MSGDVFRVAVEAPRRGRKSTVTAEQVARWRADVARGKSYAAIGQESGCSADTVKYHLTDREQLVDTAPRIRTRRRCMSCGEPFMSEGKHHRMCDYCRTHRDGSILGQPA